MYITSATNAITITKRKKTHIRLSDDFIFRSKETIHIM